MFAFYRFVGGGPMSHFFMTRRSLDATLSLRVYQYCVNLFLDQRTLLQIFGSWKLVQTAVPLVKGVYCRALPRKLCEWVCRRVL